MDHSKGLALALLLSASVGCSSLLSYVDRPFREPGERLSAFPEKVWKQYECDKKRLPFFKLERVELFPKRLEPGGRFKQRLVYALCPRRNTGVVTGTLETKILHRGRPIVHERDTSYDLKPGRWVVDAFVDLPGDAGVGVYAFELRFRSNPVRFERSMTFAVESN